MIAALLSLLGSSAIGSIIGGVFALMNKKTDLEVKKLEFQQDLLIRDKDIELAKAEAAGKKEVAIIEGDASVDSARMNAIAVVQKADSVAPEEIVAAGKLGWMYVVAAVFNKLVRPVSTVVLLSAALSLNYLLIDKFAANWAHLTAEQQFESSMQAFAWITGQAGAVLAYWFVSRGSSK